MKKRYLIIAALFAAVPAAAETATLTTKPAPAGMTTEEFENWGAPASAKPSKPDLSKYSTEELKSMVADSPKELSFEEVHNVVWDETPSWFGVPVEELLGRTVLVVGAGWLAWRGLRLYNENPQKLARGFKKGVVWSVLGLVGLMIVSNPNLVSSPVVAAVIVICYLQTRGATK